MDSSGMGSSGFLVYGMDLQCVIRWIQMIATALVIFCLSLPFIGFLALCLCTFGGFFAILLALSVLSFAFLLELEASVPIAMKPLLGFIAWVFLHLFSKISSFNGQLENEERSSGNKHHGSGIDEGISFEEEASTYELKHSEGCSIEDINKVGAENVEPPYKYRLVRACKPNEYENTFHPNFVDKTSMEVKILNPVTRTSYPEKTGEQKHAEVFGVQFGGSNSEQRLIELTGVHVNKVCHLGEELFSNDEVGMKFLRVNSINGCLDSRWGCINHWNVRKDYLSELEALTHVGVSATERRFDEFAEDIPPTQFHELLKFWQRKERKIQGEKNTERL